MGCCGKGIKTIKNIARGYTALALNIKYEFTDDRVRVCQKCDYGYWIAKTLWCRICKCSVPAAARAKDKKCPKNFWSK